MRERGKERGGSGSGSGGARRASNKRRGVECVDPVGATTLCTHSSSLRGGRVRVAVTLSVAVQCELQSRHRGSAIEVLLVVRPAVEMNEERVLRTAVEQQRQLRRERRRRVRQKRGATWG